MEHQELHELISIFKNNEFNNIQKKIRLISSNTESKYTVRLLNKLSGNDKPITIDEIINSVYANENKNNKKSIKKLINRSKQKLLDTLLVNVNENSFGTDEQNLIKVKIYKKAALFHLLSEIDGRVSVADKLLNEIIGLSRQNEFYNVVSDFLLIKIQKSGIRYGDEKVEELLKDLKFSITCRDFVEDAIELTEGFQLMCNKQNPNKDILEALQKKNISLLRKMYKLTCSPLIKYYLLFHELTYLIFQKNYIRGIKKGKAVLKFLNSSKSAKQANSISTTYCQIGTCYIHLKEYKKAFSWFYKSSESCPQASRRYFISLENMVIIYLYLDRPQHSALFIDKLIEGAKYFYSNYELQKLIALKVNILLQQREYKASLQILNTSNELLNDKAGFGMNSRILNVVLKILLNKQDEADRDIECLRKFIIRNKAKYDFKMRDILFIKLLITLKNNHYIFDFNNKKISSIIDGLKENDWEALSSEILPYEGILSLIIEKNHKDQVHSSIS